VVTTRLPAAPGVKQDGTLWHRTTLGARIFARTPELRGLLALNLVVAAATALVLVNTVVYVRDRFGGSNADVAIALACYGAGSMAAALMAPWILDRVTDRSLMRTGAGLLCLGLAGVFVLLAATGSWPLLLGLWVVLGAGTSMVNTPSARLLRRAATDSTRSYIFTAQFSLSHACYIITYPVAGWVGAAAGQPAAAAVLAAVATISTVAALKFWPAAARTGPVPATTKG
jgi:MFS family permease